MDDFGVINWSILVIYIIANLGLGAALSQKIHSSQDFFLGDRSIPWWAIGVSVVSTYVSALTFLGGPAWSYTEGLSVMAIHLNYPLVVVIVVTFFLPFFYNSGVASIYDYQERRFGTRSRVVLASVFLLSQGATAAAILYATSLVLEFLTGLPVAYCIMTVSVIALIYTALGGIAAVIWTDVIQAGILFVGALVIFYSLAVGFDEPLVGVLGQASAAGQLEALDTQLDFSKVTTVWSGVIAMTLFHITVYGANQMMVQRSLTAKNIGDAKKSMLTMGFAAFFIYFLFILMGVLLNVHYEGRAFENGNTIILQFAHELGIPGLMGLIAAAVMAASMSSLDSAFNSMSTVSVIDFYQRYYRPGATEEQLLRVSRVFTLVWAVIIVVPALMFAETEGSVLETLSKVGSYFVGAKLSMFGLGFFSRHTTERGLLTGVAVGFACVWYVSTYTDIAWPWFAAIGGVVNTAVAWVASLVLDGRQAAWHPDTVMGQREYFRAEGLAAKEGGWYRLPGGLDTASKLLLVFFVLTLVALYVFQSAF
jgi:SSS family solute:Na+ symporter